MNQNLNKRVDVFAKIEIFKGYWIQDNRFKNFK